MVMKPATMNIMKLFNKNTPAKQPEVDDGSKANYSFLRESSEESPSPDNELHVAYFPQRKNNIYHYLVLLTKSVLVIFAFWGICGLRQSAISLKAHEPVSCSCGGTTVAEAVSRGCVFTPLALAWLPPQCLDMELSDEFDKLGPLPGGEWPYWADRNGTTRISREEMGLLADVNGAFYTTQEWHIMHCMYTWRKHYRSKFTGVTIEKRSGGIDHIHHCEGIVLDRVPLEGIWTMAGVELNADLG